MDTYEKKYNEALERAKELRDKALAYNANHYVKDYETIFPELHEEEKPLTPFQQCLSHILYKVYYASAPGKVDKFILDIIKNRTDELVELAKRQEKTDCQLRESEDERMRKRAIAILKQQRDYWSYDGPVEKFPPATPRKDLVDAIDVALSYLEKQKEPTTEELYAEAGTTEKEYMANTMKMVRAMREKQKEQKPISQEDFDTAKHEALWEEQKPTEYLDKDKVYAVMQKLHKLAFSQLIPINSDEYKKIDEITCDIRNFLNYPIEQKPLEKQDYSGLNDLERAIHRGFLVAGVESVPVTVIKETAKECLALKPVEWLEEDEIYLQDALWCVEQATKVARDENDMGACWSAERWLKSLRPHWKPSEEQMEALAYASKVLSSALYPVAAKASEELESIREQLKKL